LTSPRSGFGELVLLFSLGDNLLIAFACTEPAYWLSVALAGVTDI